MWCYLTSFDFTIVHHAGKKQTNADVLSQRLKEDATKSPLEPLEYLHNVADIYHVDVDRQVVPAAPMVELTVPELASATAKDAVLRRLIPFVLEGSKPTKVEATALGQLYSMYTMNYYT